MAVNPDILAYDIPQMTGFLGDVQRCQSVLTAEEKDLNQLLGNILGPDWTGGASTEWQARQHEWNMACTELNGILENLAFALGTAIQNAIDNNARLMRFWGR